MEDNVLHVIDNMCLGGAQRIVSTLVKNNSNHKLHSIRKVEDSMGDFNDYTVTGSPSRYNFRSFIDVWKKVREENPEIVHCHLIKSKMIGILLKIVSIRDFKLVFHEHGHVWKENRKYNKILNYASRLVDCHIAVSEYTAKLLKENAEIPEDKINVIYNFVDREEYNPEILESFESDLSQDFDQELFTVGFGGRLEERKGWRTIVSAAERTEDVRFLISGSGTGEKELEKKTEEIDNLHYLGFIDDVRSLFASIDCFVLPSEWDPSPMILYEVQSCGIPLICADVHSIDELVEDKENALVYSFNDIEKLAEKIEEIKRDEELRRQLSEEGISNAEKYTYNVFQESLNQAYSSLKD